MYAIVRDNYKVLEWFDTLKEAQGAFPVYFEALEFDGSIDIQSDENRPDLIPQFGTKTR